MKKIIVSVLTLLTLGACSISRETPAPVVNVTANKIPKSQAKTSVPATAANNSDNQAADGTVINKIDTNEDGTVINAPSATSGANINTATGQSGIMIGGISWLTPTKGTVIHPYSVAAKGIDVAGSEGQAILAANSGKVVYSGNGLKGYGNLIIIKHQDGYLTAYSHNKVNLVQEGDVVKRGQKIAELGKTESDKPVLHFELRKNGKPLDPTPIFK